MRRAMRRAAQMLAAASLFGLLAPALGQVQRPAGPPPAFANTSRPSGDAAVESRVETAWGAQPGLAVTTPLDAVVQRGILEVHGAVPNEQARTLAMRIARDNCTLPVTDHLKIKPFAMQAAPKLDTAAALTTATTDILRKTLGPAASTVRVDVTEAGQITLAGTVPTKEHHVEVIRQVRFLPGCTTVVNQLGVPAHAPVVIGKQGPPAATSPVVSARPTLLPPQATPAPVEVVALRTPQPAPGRTADLLTPPAAEPASTTGRQAEEMHLLQLPLLGQPVLKSVTAPPRAKVPTIARSSQFATASQHNETNLVRQPIPVATAPLGTTATAPPASVPIPVPVATTSGTPQPPRSSSPVIFEEEQEPRGRTQPVATTPGVKTPWSLTPPAVQQRVAGLCGKLATNVVVIPGLGGELVVQIQVASATAEAQLTPRLLQMPELTTGRIRLEMHVPQ